MLDSMQADRTRLLDLAAKILDLERSLSALRIEQSEAQERLDVTPYPSAPVLTGLASPTTLTHVCCKWREVALTTPALWRSILLSCRGPLCAYKQTHHISDA
ncbi:hypothetical protein C8R45DRAFT_1110952 [Mycena sanguinolenta]|nr:hypothetical protein C8R45DRAFT_1110952 [Mycena sanguinolenta]